MTRIMPGISRAGAGSLRGTFPVDGPGLCAWVCEPDNGFAMASRPGETPSYKHRGDRDHGDRPDQNPGVAGEGKLSERGPEGESDGGIDQCPGQRFHRLGKTERKPAHS